MSTRSEILDALRVDFATITTGNGYNGTIRSVVKHVKDLERVDETALNFAYIFSLPETQEMHEQIGTWNWRVGFMIYFATAGLDSDEVGLIEDTAENFIEDVKQLFNIGSNPPPVGRTVDALDSIECIFIEQIEPYSLVDQEHIAVVFGTLNILYQD